MFFVQINASATLPTYLLIHLVNSNFLGWLYITVPSPPPLFVLCDTMWPFFWNCVTSVDCVLRSLIHTAKQSLTWCIIFVTARSCRNFLTVYPASYPLFPSAGVWKKELLLTDDIQRPRMNTRDKVSHTALLLKGD